MFRLLVTSLFLSISPARAEVVVLAIDGMTCLGCEAKVIKALNRLPFLSDSQASTPGGKACATLSGGLEIAAIQETLTKLGYTLSAQDLLAECPDIHAPKAHMGNWGKTDGLDASIISRGERVDLTAHIVAEKFTVFDFGADWCTPCHAAEALLKAYLADHPDVAVRAVVIEGAGPKESFAQPVVSQHLASAAGLPYFIVYNPRGDIIYRGVSPTQALQKIDRKRR